MWDMVRNIYGVSTKQFYTPSKKNCCSVRYHLSVQEVLMILFNQTIHDLKIQNCVFSDTMTEVKHLQTNMALVQVFKMLCTSRVAGNCSKQP